jgi:sugar O-acyltransferase (sialic acid O-acetyltransferase NeuD family)
MLMENIIVIGSSGHAKVVIDTIEKQGLYKIVGLIDDFRHVGERTWEYSVLGRVEDLPRIVTEYSSPNILIAIGSNFGRKMVAEKIYQFWPAIHFPCIVHPNNVISRNVSVGEGTIIGPQVRIAPDCQIGRFCNLLATSNIGHDVMMGDFCSIAPGTAIGGNVEIGYGTAISLGVTINQRVIVGEHTIIGTGAIVVRDVPSYVVAYGSPAKIIRSRKLEENYL